VGEEGQGLPQGEGEFPFRLGKEGSTLGDAISVKTAIEWLIDIIL
jgi:hypothetical protein